MWELIVVGAVLAAAAFVLAPLARSEEDLERIHRPRPGVRNIRGPTPEALEPPHQPPAEQSVVCPHCGSSVAEEYRYCGQCTNRLR